MITLAPPRTTVDLRPYVLAAVAFGGYALWALMRLRTFDTTGYDLGIFEQAVKSYAHGHWPTSDLLGPGAPTLGDHFHPILAVLAPFYLLWPSPAMLLVAQAALFAVSAIPVTRSAIRILGTRRGVMVGVGYTLSCGLLSAVNFDFHEVAFAVPLLAFAAERLLLERWREAVWFAAPIVLVKEDLPMTLAAVGIVLVLKGQKRLGWTVAAAGVATTALLVLVVLPALNPAGAYAHSSGYAPFGGLVLKLGVLFALFAPTAFAALRSPLAILLIPTLLWRLTSADTRYWTVGYHYSAVLMPLVVIAALDGVRRCPPRQWRLIPACMLVAGVATLGFQLAHLTAGTWTAEQRAGIEEVLAKIPDGATVAASNRLAPKLTGRCTVLFFDSYPSETVRPEWVVVSNPETAWPSTPADKEARAAELEREDYRRVDATDSVVLLHRG